MFKRCFGCKKSPSPQRSPQKSRSPNTRNNMAKRIMNQHLESKMVPYNYAKKLTLIDLLSLKRKGRISEKDFWGAFNYMRRKVNLNNSRKENLAEINARYPWYYKNNHWGRYALGPTNFIVQDRNTLQFYRLNRNSNSNTNKIRKHEISNKNMIPFYKYIRQIPRTSNFTEKAYLKRTRVTRPRPVNTRQRALLKEINRIRANIPSYGNVGKENARQRLHVLRKRYELLKNLDKLQNR